MNWSFNVLFDKDDNQNYEYYCTNFDRSAMFHKIDRLFNVLMDIYIRYKKNYKFIECKKFTKLIEKKIFI